MKPLLPCILVFTAACCSAESESYQMAAGRADAAAIARVTSSEQSYREGTIYESAIFTVEVPIRGLDSGEKVQKSSGRRYQPGEYSNRTYVIKRDLGQDAPVLLIGDRYLVLLERRKGRWELIRQSLILEDVVRDATFEEFAGAENVPVATAISLLKARPRK
ncbi:MAG TPA: hypothetical protein VG734_02755 [Lacunisphaera sp.]|nr:hypothetical protein [Lacunisphaera sp.]